MNTHKTWGAVRTFFYLRSPNVQKVVAAVAKEVVDQLESSPREKILVIMTGMSLSGKTTHVKNHSKLGGYGQVRTRNIHNLLNRNLDFLRDDNSIRGRAYWVRQFLTEAVREEAIRRALGRGVALVLDSCHLTRKKRAKRYGLAKRYGYQVTIIFIDCSWTTLLTRARAADDESVARGGKRVWEDLINRQRKEFEIPTSNEADELINV